jgi:hypothetical protein
MQYAKERKEESAHLGIHDGEGRVVEVDLRHTADRLVHLRHRQNSQDGPAAYLYKRDQSPDTYNSNILPKMNTFICK